MKITFINAAIVTVNENFDVIYDGELEVTDNIITYVGKQRNLLNYEYVINCKGNILMPGLINCNCQAQLGILRGSCDGLLFDNWQDYVFIKQENLTHEEINHGVEICVNEMLQNGITTFFDNSTKPEFTIEVCKKLGMRVGVGFGALTGQENLTLESLENEYNSLIQHNNVIPYLFAKNTYDCDEYQFGLLIKMAKKYNLVICSQVSQTLDEVGVCHNANGVTPVGLLESYGVFDVPCVLTHCVHIDKDDIALIKQYYSNVSICNCPATNLKLANGICPVSSIINNNINVCLGTGNVAGNNNLDLLKEMNLTGNLQYGLLNNPKAISAEMLIKMATINGAKAFGINNLGSIKVGNFADIIMLDCNMPNMQPLNNLISNIAFSATNKNVVMTMVNGKILYNNFF